jgi:hypothetical protein
VSSTERMAVLARFLRNQIALADRAPPGCVQLNNEEAAVCAQAIEQLTSLERELWVIAEAIFQNISSDEAKHWARGIQVSIGGPANSPPKITATQAPPSSNQCVHELKVAAEFFDAIESGQKPFEIRKGDRPFKIGDTLWLREVNIVLAYTGRETRKRITFCLRGWGMESGYVALGLAPLQDETKAKPARDADHCDFPDCEQHWLFVLQDILKHCDLAPAGETEFERAIIRARRAVKTSGEPAK